MERIKQRERRRQRDGGRDSGRESLTDTWIIRQSALRELSNFLKRRESRQTERKGVPYSALGAFPSQQALRLSVFPVWSCDESPVLYTLSLRRQGQRLSFFHCPSLGLLRALYLEGAPETVAQWARDREKGSPGAHTRTGKNSSLRGSILSL